MGGSRLGVGSKWVAKEGNYPWVGPCGGTTVTLGGRENCGDGGGIPGWRFGGGGVE